MGGMSQPLARRASSKMATEEKTTRRQLRFHMLESLSLMQDTLKKAISMTANWTTSPKRLTAALAAESLSLETYCFACAVRSGNSEWLVQTSAKGQSRALS